MTARLVLGWITILLTLDVWASPAGEWALGAATWVVLGFVLRRSDNLVRAQAAVVVVFATIVEYTFSAGLGVYSYRHGGVPAFVPPGHGLVYLGAKDLGERAWLRHGRPWVAGAVTLWALWGLSPLAPRLDVLGAFWAVCLLLFLWLRHPHLFSPLLRLSPLLLRLSMSAGVSP